MSSKKTINQKIRELLDERIGAEGIVYDGIVSEEQFGSILYLLKEANNSQKGPQAIDYYETTNLIEETGTRAEEQVDSEPKHWPALCYWTEAFTNPDAAYAKAKDCGGNLKKLAIVTIKKTPGTGSPSDRELKSAVKNYGSVLQEEIALIKPKLVVCCGVFEYAKSIFGVAEEDILELDSGAKCFVVKQNRRNVVFLEFFNPALRISKPAIFAYAKSIARDLEKKFRMKL